MISSVSSSFPSHAAWWGPAAALNVAERTRSPEGEGGICRRERRGEEGRLPGSIPRSLAKECKTTEKSVIMGRLLHSLGSALHSFMVCFLTMHHPVFSSAHQTDPDPAEWEGGFKRRKPQ